MVMYRAWGLGSKLLEGGYTWGIIYILYIYEGFTPYRGDIWGLGFSI